MQLRMTKLVGVGLTLLYLSGCVTRFVEDTYTQDAQEALLLLCTTAPVGKAGTTNGSLAEAFLVTRESLMVCKGVTQSMIGE